MNTHKNWIKQHSSPSAKQCRTVDSRLAGFRVCCHSPAEDAWWTVEAEKRGNSLRSAELLAMAGGWRRA